MINVFCYRDIDASCCSLAKRRSCRRPTPDCSVLLPQEIGKVISETGDFGTLSRHGERDPSLPPLPPHGCALAMLVIDSSNCLLILILVNRHGACIELYVWEESIIFHFLRVLRRFAVALAEVRVKWRFCVFMLLRRDPSLP